jgi:hypothetical protein
VGRKQRYRKSGPAARRPLGGQFVRARAGLCRCCPDACSAVDPGKRRYVHRRPDKYDRDLGGVKIGPAPSLSPRVPSTPSCRRRAATHMRYRVVSILPANTARGISTQSVGVLTDSWLTRTTEPRRREMTQGPHRSKAHRASSFLCKGKTFTPPSAEGSCGPRLRPTNYS